MSLHRCVLEKSGSARGFDADNIEPPTTDGLAPIGEAVGDCGSYKKYDRNVLCGTRGCKNKAEWRQMKWVHEKNREAETKIMRCSECVGVKTVQCTNPFCYRHATRAAKSPVGTTTRCEECYKVCCASDSCAHCGGIDIDEKASDRDLAQSFCRSVSVLCEGVTCTFVGTCDGVINRLRSEEDFTDFTFKPNQVRLYTHGVRMLWMASTHISIIAALSGRLESHYKWRPGLQKGGSVHNQRHVSVLEMQHVAT